MAGSCIGNQNHVARIELTPVGIFDGRFNPGVSIFSKVTAGYARSAECIDTIEELLDVGALFQADISAGQILELGYLLQIVPISGKAEADLVGQTLFLDRGINFSHGFACVIDIRTHRNGRIDDEMNTATIAPAGLVRSIQTRRCCRIIVQWDTRNFEQASLFIAEINILVLLDRYEIKILTNFQMGFRLDRDDRGIFGRFIVDYRLIESLVGLGVVVAHQTI